MGFGEKWAFMCFLIVRRLILWVLVRSGAMILSGTGPSAYWNTISACCSMIVLDPGPLDCS